MARRDEALSDAVADRAVATTNLWYARLCKSAARVTGGALLGGWNDEERRALIAGLVALPDEVTIVPMRNLAWNMGLLIAAYDGLSTLGAEAVAAATELDADLLVSARDDGPGIRACATDQRVTYDAMPR